MPSTQPPKVTVTWAWAAPCTLTIRVCGEIDLVTVGGFAADIARLQQMPFRHAVVDVSGVDFLAASGVRVLAELREQATSRGASVEIRCGSHRIIARVLTICGLPPAP